MINTQKKTAAQATFGVLLAVCLSLGGIVRAQTQNIERERRVPAVSPTPTVTPTPRVGVVPIPSATVSPTPSPALPGQQTLPDLQTKIRSVLLRPELRRAQVAVKVVSLATGKILFEENADKLMMPASNMKSFTTAAALARLSPDFRFVTSVYAGAKPEADGTLRGDLVIYGRGDPSIAANFNNGDFHAGINALANKIAAAGVKRVEGGLVGDASYFTGDSIQPSWEWDNLQWYYGAEISALSINDNALELSIKPGSSTGSSCVVTLTPNVNYFNVVNRMTTAPAGTARSLKVSRQLGANTIEVSGALPVNDKGYEARVAVPRPALAFVTLLKNALQQRGVTFTGQTRVNDAVVQNAQPSIQNITELVRHESVPLSQITAQIMKQSNNTYTELVLRAMGESAGDKSDPKRTSAERGIEVVNKFLGENGVTSGSVVQWDGSGLSRHNLITASSLVQVYAAMNKHRYANAWRASLTVAGVDGTLENRLRSTTAANNLRGKTGTIDQVATLAGYVTTAGGEQLAFAILVNNLNENGARRITIDDIAILLADFNGRSQ